MVWTPASGNCQKVQIVAIVTTQGRLLLEQLTDQMKSNAHMERR